MIHTSESLRAKPNPNQLFRIAGLLDTVSTERKGVFESYKTFITKHMIEYVPYDSVMPSVRVQSGLVGRIALKYSREGHIEVPQWNLDVYDWHGAVGKRQTTKYAFVWSEDTVWQAKRTIGLGHLDPQELTLDEERDYLAAMSSAQLHIVSEADCELLAHDIERVVADHRAISKAMRR